MRAGNHDERSDAPRGDRSGEVAGTERQRGEDAGGDSGGWHRHLVAGSGSGVRDSTAIRGELGRIPCPRRA